MVNSTHVYNSTSRVLKSVNNSVKNRSFKMRIRIHMGIVRMSLQNLA